MTKPRHPSLDRLPAALALLVPLTLTGCGGGGSRPVAAAATGEVAAAALPEARLEPYRDELLELAFEAASKLPLAPHIKTRSEAQQAVVEACLELGQPGKALAWSERIANWRRGVGIADFAAWCAERGHVEGVRTQLERALEVARTYGAQATPHESFQDWQRDRILAAVAAAHVFLGEEGEAAKLSSGLDASQAGRVLAARARLVAAADFDAYLAGFEVVVETGNLDQVRGALEGCALLFGRFYADADLRARAEQAIRKRWDGLPAPMQIELAADLARTALEHADPATALALVDEAEQVLDGTRLTADMQIPLQARLAGLRARAGDPDTARQGLEAALTTFEQSLDVLQDFWRAETLTPVAEAYQALGDREAALAVYRRAVEEGAHNPNARPRAEDLSATCLSMALNGVEPDPDLWTRLRAIRDALGDPW